MATPDKTTKPLVQERSLVSGPYKEALERASCPGAHNNPKELEPKWVCRCPQIYIQNRVRGCDIGCPSTPSRSLQSFQHLKIKSPRPFSLSGLTIPNDTIFQIAPDISYNNLSIMHVFKYGLDYLSCDTMIFLSIKCLHLNFQSTCLSSFSTWITIHKCRTLAWITKR